MNLSGSMQPEGDAAVTPTPGPSDGFPAHDAAKAAPASLADCHDDADRLDYLCAKVQGSYTRQRNTDGTVTLRLKTAEGDVLAATKANTAEAVAHLLTRLEVSE